LSDVRRLERQILVRLSPELADAIEAAAEGRGISSAAFLRSIASDAVAGATPRDRQRSPRKTARPVISAEEAEIRGVVRSLGIAGGAAVQLTKTLREQGQPEHAAAEVVVRELREAAAHARDLVRRFAP
jgi:hypothetical protein